MANVFPELSNASVSDNSSFVLARNSRLEDFFTFGPHLPFTFAKCNCCVYCAAMFMYVISCNVDLRRTIFEVYSGSLFLERTKEQLFDLYPWFFKIHL